MVNEADQRLKELLGLITQGKWEVYCRDATNEDTDTSREGSFLGWEVHPTQSPGRGQFVSGYDAEFIALTRNRIGPLLEDLEWHTEQRFNVNIMLDSAEEALAKVQAEVERVTFERNTYMAYINGNHSLDSRDYITLTELQDKLSSSPQEAKDDPA